MRKTESGSIIMLKRIIAARKLKRKEKDYILQTVREPENIVG